MIDHPPLLVFPLGTGKFFFNRFYFFVNFFCFYLGFWFRFWFRFWFAGRRDLSMQISKPLPLSYPSFPASMPNLGGGAWLNR